jgi:23S rRNA U2552 (ribose-2'-O)-methylase RlmE/FtsJ
MEIAVFRDKRKRLVDVKNLINTRVIEWERIKHEINPLELVFTFMKGESVSKINPVSRAFFKMIEMMDIVSNDIPLHPIRTLHLAESPGGFIQAVNWKRRLLGLIDYMESWTLTKENVWKKLLDVSKTWSTKPILNTGDLLKERVRKQIIASHNTHKAFLVTGDGGFDFSDNYEEQETLALPLILSQMIVGLQCLEKDGIFVLKIFDCFTLPTIQILWVFWRVFRGFRVIKPKTSRACNSEKYIVARGFKGCGERLQSFLKNMEGLLRKLETDDNHTHVTNLFEKGDQAYSWDTMDAGFVSSCTSIIGSLIDTQTMWIQRGIDGYSIPRSEKVRMAIEWCRKYGIPINHVYYQKHPLLKNSEESEWQVNHRQFSLRRRLTSVSPLLFD